jgi:predicted dehydrogenase
MSSILRIGVIGAGHFGRFHALKIASSKRAALVGLTDLNPERAALVGRELGGVPAMGLADLLETSQAVIVAAPAEAHYDIAALALEKGRHVLVEKPIAATLAQADQLAELARAQNLVLQVGHLLRYSPEHRAISARIARPLYIEATRIAPFKPRGTDVSVILDLMIHDLDLVLSLVDSDIESVDALGAAVSSQYEDIANARVRFANGCVATITASRLTMIGRTHGIPVPGTDGFLLDEAAWEDHDVLEAEHTAFIAACLDGAPVLVDALAGRRALEAALAVAAGMARSRALAEASGLIQQIEHGAGGGL